MHGWCSSTAANVVGIGLVTDFWCRSKQPVTPQRSNIPHHLTLLCSSSTKAAVTANFTRELSLLETALLRMVDHDWVRDTVWAGQPQSMVLPDGSAKGLRTILHERGINTSTLKADDMRIILNNNDDFVNEKTQVEHYIISRGFQCYFLPKFHCELNPIERVWGQSKRYSRAHSNFTLAKLPETINPALDSVTLDLIRKYYRKVREYELAYLEGNKAGKEVEAAVKQYKSHSRIYSSIRF